MTTPLATVAWRIWPPPAAQRQRQRIQQTDVNPSTRSPVQLHRLGGTLTTSSRRWALQENDGSPYTFTSWALWDDTRSSNRSQEDCLSSDGRALKSKTSGLTATRATQAALSATMTDDHTSSPVAPREIQRYTDVSTHLTCDRQSFDVEEMHHGQRVARGRDGAGEEPARPEKTRAKIRGATSPGGCRCLRPATTDCANPLASDYRISVCRPDCRAVHTLPAFPLTATARGDGRASLGEPSG